jgi:hypothetical protein
MSRRWIYRPAIPVKSRKSLEPANFPTICPGPLQNQSKVWKSGQRSAFSNQLFLTADRGELTAVC